MPHTTTALPLYCAIVFIIIVDYAISDTNIFLPKDLALLKNTSFWRKVETPDLGCDDGFKRHSDSCYFVNTYARYKHKEAMDNCRQVGGHLVRIESFVEEDFVNRLILNKETEVLRGARQPQSGGYWIDGHRASASAGAQWTWSNGTIMNYLPWLSGQPDNPSTERNIQIYTSFDRRQSKRPGGGYNDRAASIKLGFICEKPVEAV